MKRHLLLTLGGILTFTAGLLSGRQMPRPTPTVPPSGESLVHYTSQGRLGPLSLDHFVRFFQEVATLGCGKLQVDDVLFEIPDHVGLRLMDAPSPISPGSSAATNDEEIASYIRENQPAWCFIWGPPDLDMQSVLRAGRVCHRSGVHCAYFASPDLKKMQFRWVSRDSSNFIP
jgi:hypothetical protein